VNETYTPGYSASAVAFMSGRSAERQARFILPRLKPGMRLLDIGCGPGTITVGLAAAVAPGPVTGVDMAESQLELARDNAAQNKIENVRFQRASIYELPFTDGEFEVVFAHAVFEHLKEPVAALREVTDAEAGAVLAWYLKKGVKFHWGSNPETELTEAQTLDQCKMYIAAVRLADEFGCATIGIQYQQGLKDLAPASDLVEGTLNNVDRPPVKCAKTGKVLYAREALPHFNEVDECAGLDGLVTYRLWRELGFPPENTLHDLRWGQSYPVNGKDEYVWVFLISGAAPPAHFNGGWKGASSERQPPMYFRLGGGTLKGISHAGHIVWSRVFIMDGKLHCDLGVARVVDLPAEETERRWRETTPQWPIMHAVLSGVTRDQMMARHKSNHIQVVYAPDEKKAHRACRIKAAMLAEMGLEVHLCGDVRLD